MQKRNFKDEHDHARRLLQDRDAELGRAIHKVRHAQADISWTPPTDSGLAVIVKAVISQLLSRHAADAINTRLLDQCQGSLTAESLIIAAQNGWDGIGLSRAKKATLQAVAEAIQSGALDLEALAQSSQKDIHDRLTHFKGIGSWTAEMFLLFYVCHTDILPVKDVGIWRGAMIVYNLSDAPAKEWFDEKRITWKPYCSIASLYLWRSLHIKEISDRKTKSSQKGAS